MVGHRAIACAAICVTAILSACGASDATPGGAGTGLPGSTVCAPGAACGATGTGGTNAMIPDVNGGMVGGPTVGLPGGPGAPSGGGGAAPGPANAAGVPCDVAQVVSSRCTGCHQTLTKFGAPMPLMTLADFQAPAKSNAAMKVYQIIPTRINPTDSAKRMPPTSLPALTATENQTLSAWVGAGALAATPSCAITITSVVPGTTAGPDAGTVAGTTGGSGGASIDPIDYNDPEMKCYKFLSHAQGSNTAPYSATPGEVYMDFDFAAPWQGTQYQRAIKLVIDPNSQVIHHWLLFKQTGPVTDGAIVTGTGTHPDGILLHGWAPGASPLYLDPDVGVQLESTVGYQLEIHFNNATGLTGDDQSGAEVCVTPKMPTHIAEISWVGTDAISGITASGTCVPNSNQPIHIIAAQPHTHTHKVTCGPPSVARWYATDAPMTPPPTMTMRALDGHALVGLDNDADPPHWVDRR